MPAVVLVDSGVLIHLSRVGRLDILKRLFGKVSITEAVYRETVDEPKEKAGATEIEKAVGKWIEVTASKKSREAGMLIELERLEKTDAELIVLAKQKQHMLVSNDFALIRVARTKGIDCCWLTTLLLKCVKKKILTKKQAMELLFELVQAGMRLNVEVYAAVERTIESL